MSVTNRAIIVTGAGQGIGAEIARDLAGHGARVVVADFNTDGAERVSRWIVDAGGAAISQGADVTNEQQVQELVSSSLSKWGSVDGLINCAARFSTIEMKPFEEISLAEWEDVMRVNTTGTFLTCRAVSAPMREAGFGRIVNFSSQAVTMGRIGYLHYIASKSAIIGMTRSMAREMGADGVTVNAIMPGYTPTEVPRETASPAQEEAILNSQSIRRFGAPADMTGMVRFLCSEDAAFISGQCQAIDGGFMYP